MLSHVILVSLLVAYVEFESIPKTFLEWPLSLKKKKKQGWQRKEKQLTVTHQTCRVRLACTCLLEHEESGLHGEESGLHGEGRTRPHSIVWRRGDSDKSIWL